MTDRQQPRREGDFAERIKMGKVLQENSKFCREVCLQKRNRKGKVTPLKHPGEKAKLWPLDTAC